MGGFAASGWVFSRLEKQLADMQLVLSRPDSHVYVSNTSVRPRLTIPFCRNKAVADGAVSFYLDRFVSSRVARWTYGVECNRLFDKSNPEHLIRSHKVNTRASGDLCVSDGFNAILIKVRRPYEHALASGC